MANDSLYSRLGGYDAIAAVVDDFIQAVVNDTRLGKYFENLGDDSCQRAQQLTVDFVCEATGGPVHYLGRDMLTAHKGMGIDDADWDKAVELLTGTLNKFDCPAQERDELLGCVASLKNDIVE